MNSLRVLLGRYVRDTLRLVFLLAFNLTAAIFFLVVLSGTFGRLQGPQYPLVMLPFALLSAAFSAASTVSGALTADFSSGYINRLLATPCSILIVIASPLLANLIFVMGYGLLLIGIAVLLAHGALPAAGPFGIISCLLLTALWGGAIGGIGVAFGVGGRNPQFAQLATIAVFYPMVYLSPALIPTEMMEPWLVKATMFNPTTYVVVAMRSLILGGWTWPGVLLGFAVAAVMAAIFLTVAAKTVSSAINRG
ncbi:MAG TPA: ABC transporter permease [Bryobacteraceae bacterium]